jgi:hypothetical protein
MVSIGTREPSASILQGQRPNSGGINLIMAKYWMWHVRQPRLMQTAAKQLRVRATALPTSDRPRSKSLLVLQTRVCPAQVQGAFLLDKTPLLLGCC